MATIHNAMTVPDIDNDGQPDTLIPAGILWMQGEADGDSPPEVALKYYDGLTRIMNRLRAAMHTDDLPVVVGEISDSHTHPDRENGTVYPQGPTILAAQTLFVEQDPCAALVTSTQQYEFTDRWHYTSPSYIDLGIQFANQIDKLPPIQI